MSTGRLAIDPMHAARLALAEAALCNLLRAAQDEDHPHDSPDQVTVSLHAEGVEIEYLRAGLPVGGEGL